jgi:cold-inducible RNA-binding protein
MLYLQDDARCGCLVFVEPIPTDSHTFVGVTMRRRMKLYVGGLPYQTTDQDLIDLFGQIGQVLSATVITDRDTGRSKGFGFVEMTNDQQAHNAMAQFNGASLGGRTIIVNVARERRERPYGERRY